MVPWQERASTGYVAHFNGFIPCHERLCEGAGLECAPQVLLLGMCGVSHGCAEVLTRWSGVPIWPKAPRHPSAPGVPALLLATQHAPCVSAYRPWPLLPVPSRGLWHGGERVSWWHSSSQFHSLVVISGPFSVKQNHPVVVFLPFDLKWTGSSNIGLKYSILAHVINLSNVGAHGLLDIFLFRNIACI